VKRTRNTVVEKLIKLLQGQNGQATASQVCRDVLGLENCDDRTAKAIIASGLPEDGRIKVSSDGMVLFNQSLSRDTLIEDIEFVVIDIEATSLPAPKNRMTEFAAVLVADGEIMGEYSTLVNPGIRIPAYVKKITGINDEMVKEAPPFENLADEVVELIGERVIVAHNSQFDVGLLNSELERAKGFRLENKSICTVKLARKLQPGLDKYRLGDVARYFDIDIEERHRALADAMAAAKILLRLLDIAEDKGLTRWSQLSKAASTGNSGKSKNSK
jgi:DNA polymerase-3 subunit alpha (Gram-positive type)